jgi:hypothetical protein
VTDAGIAVTLRLGTEKLASAQHLETKTSDFFACFAPEISFEAALTEKLCQLPNHRDETSTGAPRSRQRR